MRKDFRPSGSSSISEVIGSMHRKMFESTLTERGRIGHSRPTLGPEDERAVAEAVRSGSLRDGERAIALATAIAGRLGRAGAVALSSGSAALHLALKAVGVGEGDRVAIPSYECVSILQAVRRAGAAPLVVDCDPRSFHMDPEDLIRRGGGSARAIVFSHTFGRPGDLDPFLAAGPPVLEDAATALGARRRGRPAGALGRAAICSFNATKMITTGGGGALACDDPGILDLAMDLVRYDARDDAEIRYNERMGEMEAALGLSQLARLDSFLRRRRELAAAYGEELLGAPVLLPETGMGVDPSWHRFVIRVAAGAEPVRANLARRGIDSPRPVHIPLHRILGLEGFPGADAADREALSLPIYPTLTVEEARWIARQVRACLTEA